MNIVNTRPKWELVTDRLPSKPGKYLTLAKTQYGLEAYVSTFRDDGNGAGFSHEIADPTNVTVICWAKFPYEQVFKDRGLI